MADLIATIILKYMSKSSMVMLYSIVTSVISIGDNNHRKVNVIVVHCLPLLKEGFSNID